MSTNKTDLGGTSTEQKSRSKGAFVWTLFAGVALGALTGTGTNYYVSETGSDTENDGSEQAPFRTPEYALKKATANWDNVYVMKGVYKLSETPQIRQNNIGLYAYQATRDEVVFDGQGRMRCLQFVTNSAGAVTCQQNFRVKGITFRNGYAELKSSAANWYGQGAGALLSSHGGSGGGYAVSVVDCVFEGCTNRYCSGGGLSITAGNGETRSVVSNCVFRNNMTCALPSTAHAGPMGGGAGAYVTAASGPGALFTHCAFIGNVSTNGVAALGAGAYSNQYGHYTNKTGVVVRHCDFIENTSVNNGTGNDTSRSAGCLSQKAWLAEDCTFVSNRAEVVDGNAGGGVYTCTWLMTPNCTNTFRRCTFFANSSNGNGGVICHSSASPLVVDACTFATNFTRSASGNGTCVYAVSSAVRMTDCVATGNYVNASGLWHGDFNLGPGSRVEDCVFCGNSVSGNYGNLFVKGGSVVERCVFAGNSHRGDGNASFGYLHLNDGNALVRNCLFADNSSASGHASALLSRGTGSRVENCTFVGNKSNGSVSGESDGAAIGGDAGLKIVNSLFAQNIARVTTTGQISPKISPSDISYCWADTADTVSAGENGNLPVGDGKPYFDTKSEYAYMPSRRTPGRDKAQILDWMSQGQDLYGATRISGPGPDFGCVERPFVFTGLLLMVR